MPDERETPERLWKYRPWDSIAQPEATRHARNMLVRGEIYFAPKEKLNDPFELRWLDQFHTDLEQQKLLATALLAAKFPMHNRKERKAGLPNMLAQVQHYAAINGGVSPNVADVNMGMFCAAECHDNIVMWSHYADHHKGVCIGFNPRRTGKLFKEVNYLDSIPTNDVWNYTKMKYDMVPLSKFKSTYWEHEKEWRTIAEVGAYECQQLVEQVVLGAVANDRMREEVLAAVAEADHEILIFESKLSVTQDFILDIVPLAGGQR